MCGRDVLHDIGTCNEDKGRTGKIWKKGRGYGRDAYMLLVLAIWDGL